MEALLDDSIYIETVDFKKYYLKPKGAADPANAAWTYACLRSTRSNQSLLHLAVPQADARLPTTTFLLPQVGNTAMPAHANAWERSGWLRCDGSVRYRAAANRRQ